MIALVVASALVEEINDGASSYGLVLALDTVFTAELQRRVQALGELDAPKKARLRTVEGVTASLILLTTTSFIALGEWGVETILTVGGSDLEPGLVIFEVSWLLLLGLIVWQVIIVHRVRSIASEKGTT